MDKFHYFSCMRCAICHKDQEIIEKNKVMFCKNCHPISFNEYQDIIFGHSSVEKELPKIEKAPCVLTPTT